MRFQCPARLATLFQTALKLASSTRPQDCTTAAYLLRVLLDQPLIRQVVTQSKDNLDQPQDVKQNSTSPSHAKDKDEDSSVNPKASEEDSAIKSESSAHGGGDEEAGGDMSERYLVVLKVLMLHLKQQLEVANKSLIHAAATQPLYPTMHCIRCLLSDFDLRYENTLIIYLFIILTLSHQ